jgi:hypothetical protein
MVKIFSITTFYVVSAVTLDSCMERSVTQIDSNLLNVLIGFTELIESLVGAP